MKYKLHALALIATLSTPGYAASFGDQVADCLARKGVPTSGPQFDAAVPVCEREVQASEDAIAAAVTDLTRQEWSACLKRTLQTLDDGVSPIGDVAEALGTACRTEYVTMMRSLSPGQPAPSHTRQRDASRPALLPLILAERAARRGAKPKQ